MPLDREPGEARRQEPRAGRGLAEALGRSRVGEGHGRSEDVASRGRVGVQRPQPRGARKHSLAKEGEGLKGLRGFTQGSDLLRDVLERMPWRLWG